MEFLNKSIMNSEKKLSTIEKRKLTIQKKALDKQLRKEKYLLKLGIEKINEIKEKIKETKIRNIEKKLVIPNQKLKTSVKSRKYEIKALGGIFKEITIEDANLTIETGMFDLNTPNRELIIKSIKNTVTREFLNKPDNIQYTKKKMLMDMFQKHIMNYFLILHLLLSFIH